MATKKEEIEVLTPEVVEDLSIPDWDFEKKSLKKPIGKRKKDFPAFTQKTRDRILATTQLGVPLDVAAEAAGVATSTVERWLERGALGYDLLDKDEDADLAPVEEDFVEFYIAYNKQAATGVVRLADLINKACKENPNLALRWIEKLHPYFSPKQSIEMTGKVAHAHLHASLPRGEDIAKQLTTDELRELRADMKRKQLKAGEVGDE